MCFFLTPSRQPLDQFVIWPAYCQIVFLKNPVCDFCFLSPFSNNKFFKGSADDLSPLTLFYCYKRTNACVKNRRHSFLEGQEVTAMVIVLSGTGVEFTQTCAFTKPVLITLSLTILRF